MVAYTGSTGSSREKHHDQVNEVYEDPFEFDERLLNYSGYRKENQVRYAQQNTSQGPPSVELPVQQTSHYRLPVPPPSNRPRPAYDVTPVKDHNGPHVPNSGKLRLLLSPDEEPNFNAGQYQLSSSIIPLDKEEASSRQYRSQTNLTPTTSPFFNHETADNQQPRNLVNDTGMLVLGGIDLISVHKLPDRLRSIFPYPAFNRMQSRCFKTAYSSDDNLVVSAPTASGKTTVFELAICRLITQTDMTNVKIVYIGPTKALCEERYEDWNNRFQHLGIACALLTGDSDSYQQHVLRQSQLIITTPEKWDSITRKWHDKDKLMNLVRLLLVDEIHILNEDRGATVEAIVTRMKTMGKPTRLIALSATIPNAADVATWLGNGSKRVSVPAHLEVFGNEFRPCVLQKVVWPFQINTSDFALDHHLNPVLMKIIKQYSSEKPIMVFCPTRKSAKSTAKYLAGVWESASRKFRSDPHNMPRIQDEDLKSILNSGVAYHHAGLDTKDRKSVERAYLNGDLAIICCTSTLAVGVNLPCHLVIIKNTVKYAEGVFSEYSDLDIMQMLGRAGRPQFGDHGIGVILTREGNVARYESMDEGKALLESHLHLNLIEHLNAEITLGTIHSLQDAKLWLANTFFFVRLQKNREHYFPRGLSCSSTIDQQLEQLCVTNISNLWEHKMVEANTYRSTEFGELMTRQYIAFNTMISFVNADHGAQVEDILVTLCSVEELRGIKLDFSMAALCKACSTSLSTKRCVATHNKHAEKMILAVKLALSRITHAEQPPPKCSSMLYHLETSTVLSRLQHLVRGLIECRAILQDGVSVSHALELSRSLAAKAWDNTALVLLQLPGVGPALMRNFKELGVRNFEDLMERPIEHLARCGRGELFVTKLLSAAREVPALRIDAKVQHRDMCDDYPRIYCRVEVGSVGIALPKSFNKKKVSLDLVVIRSDGHLILYKHIQDIDRQSELVQVFPAKIEEYGQTIVCQVSCNGIAGTLKQAMINPNIQAHIFKNPQTLRLKESMAPIARIACAKSSKNDEFSENELDAEDFLAAESERFMPIDDFKAPNDTSSIGHAKGHSVFGAVSSLNPINDTRVAMAPVRQAAAKPTKSGNQKYKCLHPCKDKSNCKHGACCKEGLNKPPVKKPPKSKEISRASKEVSELKNPISKTPKGSGSKLERQHASKLLGKVTKPAIINKRDPSILARIHDSVKGPTLPMALLARNSRVVTEQSIVSQAPVSHDLDMTDEIDEEYHGAPVELAAQDQEAQETADDSLSVRPLLFETRSNDYHRKRHRPLPDISSDSELEDFQPYDFSCHTKPTKAAEKRKATIEINDSCKKVCTTNKTIQHDIPTILIPPAVSGASSSHTSHNDTMQDFLEDAAISPQLENDEVAEMSQEIASYRPFKEANWNEKDFMAQFEDCCEFIE